MRCVRAVSKSECVADGSGLVCVFACGVIGSCALVVRSVKYNSDSGSGSLAVLESKKRAQNSSKKSVYVFHKG